MVVLDAECQGSTQHPPDRWTGQGYTPTTQPPASGAGLAPALGHLTPHAGQIPLAQAGFGLGVDQGFFKRNVVVVQRGEHGHRQSQLFGVVPVVARGDGFELRGQLQPVFLNPAVILLQAQDVLDQGVVALADQGREDVQLLIGMVLTGRFVEEHKDVFGNLLRVCINAMVGQVLQQLGHVGQHGHDFLVVAIQCLERGLDAGAGGDSRAGRGVDGGHGRSPGAG